MKRSIILLLLLVLILAGCNNKQELNKLSETKSDTLQSPNFRYLTEQQLQAQVNKEIHDILSLANDERIVDAIEIIGLTERAVINILDSNYSAAIDKLEDAIGKATIMTTTRPDLMFFPLDVNVTVRDLVADPIVLENINKEAERLTDKGYLQAARHLLKDLASEIEISTPMLPVATYPDALADAAKALYESRNDEALFILNTALNTIFVETRYIPLPIIRAERMLAEVSTLLEDEDKENDTNINTLLDNAEYQIQFAEALGYGKHDEEFEELYLAIKDIRKELIKMADGNSSNLTDTLRKKLNVFKNRISEEENTESVEK